MGIRIRVTSGLLGMAGLALRVERRQTGWRGAKVATILVANTFINLRITNDYAYREGRLVTLLRERMEEQV